LRSGTVLWRSHCRSEYIWVPLYGLFGARSNTIFLIPTGLSCITCGDPGLSGMPSTQHRPIGARPPNATAAPRQVGLRLAPRAGLWAGAGSTHRPARRTHRQGGFRHGLTSWAQDCRKFGPQFLRSGGWRLSQWGMSRIEDGKTGGIFPRVCSAACIATMYP
jgi:hypothetical protein